METICRDKKWEGNEIANVCQLDRRIVCLVDGQYEKCGEMQPSVTTPAVFLYSLLFLRWF
jgi:hypothetical protein